VTFDRFDDLCNNFVSTFETIRQEFNLKKRVVDPVKTTSEDMDDDEGLASDAELILLPRAEVISELERTYRFMYSGKE
jgi:hypothetical protein